ncbi:hypothetical protein FACS1894218_1700 [Bacilli bacterium]|nr:hypothetical protein FACS1894218_1700 [Bacilli bacterium]
MLKGLKLWHYAPNPKTTPAIESIDKYKEQMEKDKNHILSAIAIKNYKEADKRLEEFKKRYKVKEFNVSSSQPTKAIKEQSINKAR